MKISKKFSQRNLLKIAIGSFIATAVIQIATVASIWGIYNCPANGGACGAVNGAHTKVSVGIALVVISWTIFLASLVGYFWLKITKKP